MVELGKEYGYPWKIFDDEESYRKGPKGEEGHEKWDGVKAEDSILASFLHIAFLKHFELSHHPESPDTLGGVEYFHRETGFIVGLSQDSNSGCAQDNVLVFGLAFLGSAIGSSMISEVSRLAHVAETVYHEVLHAFEKGGRHSGATLEASRVAYWSHPNETLCNALGSAAAEYYMPGRGARRSEDTYLEHFRAAGTKGSLPKEVKARLLRSHRAFKKAREVYLRMIQRELAPETMKSEWTSVNEAYRAMLRWAS
jgi:hypothetical protein